MKELLQIFQYIQKYHEDNFDVLCLTLEFLLVGQDKTLSAELLISKTKEIPQSFYCYLQKHNLTHKIAINSDLNYKTCAESQSQCARIRGFYSDYCAAKNNFKTL
ncbi:MULTISPECIES: hypothetical protein [Helicobacter]|uniref:hypothetical protein n=1 Tax=Helicobacter TaxID=209 RepID=UPI00260A6C9F|nr:hypothetical protein [Helicobacter sp. UBA3407]